MKIYYYARATSSGAGLTFSADKLTDEEKRVIKALSEIPEITLEDRIYYRVSSTETSVSFEPDKST